MALEVAVSGKNAESYATVAELEEYETEVAGGERLEGKSEVNKEQYLRKAAILLDTAFGWKGVPAKVGQRRAWPRSGVVGVAGTEVPLGVKQAQMEIALQVAVDDTLTPAAAVSASVVVRERVKAGPVESDKSYARAVGEDPTRGLVMVRHLVVPYVDLPFGQTRVYRA